MIASSSDGLPSFCSTACLTLRATCPSDSPSFCLCSHVQRGHGQVIQTLVAPAVLAAPVDPHRHMGQPLGVLLLEEGLAQLREVVVTVRRQSAHQLLKAAAEQDEVGGALADQRLRIVELTARRLPRAGRRTARRASRRRSAA